MKRALKVISICSLAVAVLFVAYSLASAQGVDKNMVKKAKGEVDKAKVLAAADAMDAVLDSISMENSRLKEENAKLKKQYGENGKNVGKLLEELDSKQLQLAFILKYTRLIGVLSVSDAAVRTADNIYSKIRGIKGIDDNAFISKALLILNQDTRKEFFAVEYLFSYEEKGKIFRNSVTVVIDSKSGELLDARCPQGEKKRLLSLDIDDTGRFDITPCMIYSSDFRETKKSYN